MTRVDAGAFRLAAAAASERSTPLRAPAIAFASDHVGDEWSQELPGTSVELVMELHGRWDLDLGGRRTSTGAFAAGLIAGPVRSRARGAVSLVQLAVDPLSIPALLGLPAGELSGQAIDLGDVLGQDASRVLERLAAAPDLAATATQWTSRAARVPGARPTSLHVPGDVRRAVGLMRASAGSLGVQAIAKELGCSRRHLARRFAEWVGVSPSEFRRLIRFERAVDLLRADPDQPIGLLAITTGYADHAHLDREFRALAGATPTTVADRFRAAG